MPDQKQNGLSENSLGAVAYITVLPALFFLAIAPYNKSSYVRFHAWQSTILFVMTLIVSAVLSYFPAYNLFLGAAILALSSLVWLIWVLISLWCAVRALNGKRIKLPLIGAWAAQQANR
jgi:uncharacterized membrane protein